MNKPSFRPERNGLDVVNVVAVKMRDDRTCSSKSPIDVWSWIDTWHGWTYDRRLWLVVWPGGFLSDIGLESLPYFHSCSYNIDIATKVCDLSSNTLGTMRSQQQTAWRGPYTPQKRRSKRILKLDMYQFNTAGHVLANNDVEKQEAQGLGALLAKMADNVCLKLDNIAI